MTVLHPGRLVARESEKMNKTDTLREIVRMMRKLPEADCTDDRGIIRFPQGTRIEADVRGCHLHGWDIPFLLEPLIVGPVPESYRSSGAVIIDHDGFLEMLCDYFLISTMLAPVI